MDMVKETFETRHLFAHNSYREQAHDLSFGNVYIRTKHLFRTVSDKSLTYRKIIQFHFLI